MSHPDNVIPYTEPGPDFVAPVLDPIETERPTTDAPRWVVLTPEQRDHLEQDVTVRGRRGAVLVEGPVDHVSVHGEVTIGHGRDGVVVTGPVEVREREVPQLGDTGEPDLLAALAASVARARAHARVAEVTCARLGHRWGPRCADCLAAAKALADAGLLATPEHDEQVRADERARVSVVHSTLTDEQLLAELVRRGVLEDGQFRTKDGPMRQYRTRWQPDTRTPEQRTDDAITTLRRRLTEEPTDG